MRLEQLRGRDSKFDQKVGYGIEDFLTKQLASQNIQVKYGKYTLGGEEGECDLVIETDDLIIFIEVKKKPLTRASRAGSDVAIVVDLAGSLLLAHLQAGWHEVRLRRHGEMTLKDDSGQVLSVLKHDGRQIERIALSMNAYGSFQDRVLLEQLLHGQMHHQYTSIDPFFTSKLDKVNKYIVELIKQTNAINALEQDPDRNRPFFNCWFLSLPQFLVLLDGVSDSKQLKTSLWNTRHMVTNSRDFYFDHSLMLERRATL